MLSESLTWVPLFKKRCEINFGQRLKRIPNSLWNSPKHISAILSYVFMSSGILTYNQNIIMKSKYWYILTNKKSSYVLQYRTFGQDFLVCLHFWNFKITCKILDIVLAFSNKVCLLPRLPAQDLVLYIKIKLPSHLCTTCFCLQ